MQAPRQKSRSVSSVSCRNFPAVAESDHGTLTIWLLLRWLRERKRNESNCLPLSMTSSIKGQEVSIRHRAYKERIFQAL